MKSLELTRQGLVRALSAGVARSATVDAALRSRAEVIARGAADKDTEARVVRRGFGRYAIEVRALPAAIRGVGPFDPLVDEAAATPTPTAER